MHLKKTVSLDYATGQRSLISHQEKIEFEQLKEFIESNAEIKLKYRRCIFTTGSSKDYKLLYSEQENLNHELNRE